MMSDKEKLIVKKRSDDYHVQLENRPEIWACGESVDEALGNWLRTHVDEMLGNWIRTHIERLNIEIEYKKDVAD